MENLDKKNRVLKLVFLLYRFFKVIRFKKFARSLNLKVSIFYLKI